MKVLIVDDNKLILNNLAQLIAAQGYVVETACNGLAASEKLESEQYQLVIIDHLMPIMDGIQLSKHLRQHQHYTNTPIIFMTSQGQAAVHKVCNTALFTAIIEKPIDDENLVNLINALLSSNTRYLSL